MNEKCRKKLKDTGKGTENRGEIEREKWIQTHKSFGSKNQWKSAIRRGETKQNKLSLDNCEYPSKKKKTKVI